MMTQLRNTTKSEKYQQSKLTYNYTTGCLLDFAYFLKNCRLTVADLSKQKALDANSRAIQKIIFTGKIRATGVNTRVIIYYILKQSQETMLEFCKRTAKVL